MTTQRRWRAWLTRHLIDRWLANDRFRQLHFQQGEDRNPEYRIAEDVRVATDAPVSMAAGLLTAMLNVIIFVGILWNVGGDLVVEVFGHAMTVPKYLVITVVIYSALLTLAMSDHRSPHGPCHRGKERGRGAVPLDRFQLARDGECGQRAAWTGSAASLAECGVRHRDRTLAGAVSPVHAHHAGVARQHPGGPVIGWVLCAPKYLVGTMSLGEAAQAVAAFVMVQTALNWLVDNYPGLAECLSSVNRVGALLLALDAPGGESRPGDRLDADVGQILTATDYATDTETTRDAATAALPFDLNAPILAQSVFWVGPVDGGSTRH